MRSIVAQKPASQTFHGGFCGLCAGAREWLVVVGWSRCGKVPLETLRGAFATGRRGQKYFVRVADRSIVQRERTPTLLLLLLLRRQQCDDVVLALAEPVTLLARRCCVALRVVCW